MCAYTTVHLHPLPPRLMHLPSQSFVRKDGRKAQAGRPSDAGADQGLLPAFVGSLRAPRPVRVQPISRSLLPGKHSR